MSRLALRISVVFVLAAVGFLRGPIAFVHADISSDTDQDGSSDSGDAVGGQVVGVSSSGDSSIDATNRSEDVDVSTGDASGSNTHEGTVSGSGRQDPLALVIDEINGAAGGPIVPEDATREEVIEFLRLQLDVPEDAPDEAILDAFDPETEPEVIETLAALIRGDEFIGSGGDLDAFVGQSADVRTGDAILGQTVGLVTSREGEADLVLSNESLDSSAESGDANFANASESTVVASPK